MNLLHCFHILYNLPEFLLFRGYRLLEWDYFKWCLAGVLQVRAMTCLTRRQEPRISPPPIVIRPRSSNFHHMLNFPDFEDQSDLLAELKDLHRENQSLQGKVEIAHEAATVARRA